MVHFINPFKIKKIKWSLDFETESTHLLVSVSLTQNRHRLKMSRFSLTVMIEHNDDGATNTLTGKIVNTNSTQ